MVYILAKWLVGALSILIVAEFLVGMHVAGIYTALVIALLWGIINLFMRPLIFVVTLPFNVFTFTVITFIVNAALLSFFSSFVEGFTIISWWWAVGAAVSISVLNWAGNEVISAIHANNRSDIIHEQR